MIQTRADSLKVLPSNVLGIATRRNEWNGVCLDVTEHHGSGRASHHLCYERETRLTVLLDEVGSPCESRLREDQPCPVDYVPRNMYFVPAGMELWGFSADMRYVQDATLTFAIDTLSERLGEHLDWTRSRTPRLRFSDDRIWQMVKLLSEAVDKADPSTSLFGDGLTAAILALLLGDPASTTKTGGLARWQLRRTIEYIEEHMPEPVELAQLARLAGLSQSQFSRAFKAATGLAPYQYQLDIRIKRAQALLLEDEFSLEDIAEATGFNDAVHLGHTFKRRVGTSPIAWRGERKA